MAAELRPAADRDPVKLRALVNFYSEPSSGRRGVKSGFRVSKSRRVLQYGYNKEATPPELCRQVEVGLAWGV